jgi:3-oxosteroid 1-dehydrogenase
VKVDLVVVGSGLAGLSAGFTAAELGLSVLVTEKGEWCGGATANSGGQVWVGANHVAERDGLSDNIDDAMTYVQHLAGGPGAALFDPNSPNEWLVGARQAARWF